jgi:hypothetical protein
MCYRKNWIAVIVVILGLAMFVPVAQAQRQECSGTLCWAATYNRLHRSEDSSVILASSDEKGIIRSTHESKLLDNWTTHAVGLLRVIDGKWSWHGIWKEMAPDGEFIIGEYYNNDEGGTTGKLLYGTGKWKGIKGEVTNKRITAGKPIVERTDQYCVSWEGWIELPK